MANPKANESDKITGDKFESLIERAAGGPSDRKREQQPEPDDEAEEEAELDDEDEDDDDIDEGEYEDDE